MSVSDKMMKIGINQVFSYIEKNPQKNMGKIMDWVDKIAPDGENGYEGPRKAIRNVINDPQNNMHKLILNIFNTVDTEVLKKTFENFFLNANLIGWQKQQEEREKHGCNIPWAILLDPTSSCNLHCKGCWASEYENKLNLSFDEIDRIIEEGKSLGVYMYIYTGGEPLMRKKDIIALCKKHSDCQFLTFTNGTLIDEEFAKKMLDIKNLIPAISVEGSEEATDARRGKGTYKKVVNAMKILRENRLPFGISSCYTSQNLDSISSDEYFDQMISWGAKFVWYFHYMPVGNDAIPELLPSPVQREFMYHKVRKVRNTKPIFAMDFQNDGEYVDGCIAGARRYFHINANGDCDPCVFVHYSDSNIREKSLLEVFKSPCFMAYHDNQPFNENHLRPCPMLENPDILNSIVKKYNLKSTDMLSPESVDHLCDKCRGYSENWKETADKLWANSQK